LIYALKYFGLLRLAEKEEVDAIWNWGLWVFCSNPESDICGCPYSCIYAMLVLKGRDQKMYLQYISL
jgi:hypothetical protein